MLNTAEREELYEIYTVRWLRLFFFFIIFKYGIYTEHIAFALHRTQQIFCQPY